MKDKKKQSASPANTLSKSDEIEELKNFIKKKELQNIALKKIMTKLDAEKNHTSK